MRSGLKLAFETMKVLANVMLRRPVGALDGAAFFPALMKLGLL